MASQQVRAEGVRGVDGAEMPDIGMDANLLSAGSAAGPGGSTAESASELAIVTVTGYVTLRVGLT